MKQLTIVSGKGGTGKTTVAAALAALLGQRKVMADCDVDASNLQLALQAAPRHGEPFQSGQVARIDPDRCDHCGLCIDHCQFNAICRLNGVHQVDPLSCEGCGVCALVCPVSAVVLETCVCGQILESETAYGPLVHASLHPGRQNSGQLVSEVRKRAQDRAEQSKSELILIDGSPGIGCPVIASLTGVDLALVVTEPTPTGLGGLIRVMETARHFDIPCMACVNKADLNPGLQEEINSTCADFDAPVIGSIPFDRQIVEANARLVSIVELGPSPAEEAFRRLAERVESQLEHLSRSPSF